MKRVLRSMAAVSLLVPVFAIDSPVEAQMSLTGTCTARQRVELRATANPTARIAGYLLPNQKANVTRGTSGGWLYLSSTGSGWAQFSDNRLNCNIGGG